MTFPFQSQPNINVSLLEQIISFSQEHQCLLGAQCVWLIALLIGLQHGLVIDIDNLASGRALNNREISITPRDIPKSISPEKS